jgi:hypothetical protein
VGEAGAKAIPPAPPQAFCAAPPPPSPQPPIAPPRLHRSPWAARTPRSKQFAWVSFTVRVCVCIHRGWGEGRIHLVIACGHSDLGTSCECTRPVPQPARNLQHPSGPSAWQVSVVGAAAVMRGSVSRDAAGVHAVASPARRKPRALRGTVGKRGIGWAHRDTPGAERINGVCWGSTLRKPVHWCGDVTAGIVVAIATHLITPRNLNRKITNLSVSDGIVDAKRSSTPCHPNSGSPTQCVAIPAVQALCNIGERVTSRSPRARAHPLSMCYYRLRMR